MALTKEQYEHRNENAGKRMAENGNYIEDTGKVEEILKEEEY